MPRILPLLLALAAFFPGPLAQAQPRPPQQAELQAAVQAQPRPMALFVAGQGVRRPFGAAAGLADADARRPLTVDTPLRIASNTKTFVAATVLRLWEQGRINLDAPIGPLLTPALDALLRADGYDTGRITVRHLLSHSGGLFDHAQDPRYIQASMADPGRRWTREELVRLAARWGDPLSAPGTAFRYSDTGYILIGDIIERITGQNLGAAVRAQLRLDRLGLRSTWWEVMENAPRRAPARARQWIGDAEATGIHASVDLYGGGGLLMSARDLAILTAALFEGRLFDRPATLREMFWQGPHRGARTYRLGIFVKYAGGREYYWHSGFWGTAAYYDPAARIAVAGVSTNQDGYRPLVQLVERTLGIPPQPPAPR